jgi:hypothetical protein
VLSRFLDRQASSLSREALAFLTKAAKGIKGTGLSLEVISEVAPLLGWTLTAHPIAVKLSQDDFWEKAPFTSPDIFRNSHVYNDRLWLMSEDVAKQLLHDTRHKFTEVSSEPSNPEPGIVYVSGLSKAPHEEPVPSGAGHKWTIAMKKAWIGKEGWTLAAAGQVLQFAPDAHGELPQARLWTFLYKNGLKESAAQVLSSVGAEVVDRALRPSTVRDIENTGTCPCCFKNVKLVGGGVLMRHGWQVGGDRQKGVWNQSWHSGPCFGTGLVPFEVSPEGTKSFIELLTRRKEQIPLDAEGREQKIRNYEDWIKDLNHRLVGWKPQPLPGTLRATP